ncbi:STAS domain-containing protein [Saccharopolyspora rhizosphaerae]|nr:STAS domain-containing protein [Saccharopolyspora rhizosphaerae]
MQQNAPPATRQEPKPPTQWRTASRTGSGLQLRVDYPVPGVTAITIAGVIDEATLPRLAELVRPRLTGVIGAIVLDLSAVTFISVSGLELLKRTSMDASSRGISLRLVATTHAVLRAFRIAGLDRLECHSDVADALSPPARTQF